MKLMDKAKQAALAAAVKTGLGYLEKDPEVNIPKLMELVDKFVPDGWYESQRNAIRNAIQNKDSNWYKLILRIYELDPGVREAFFTNFIINASLKGSALQEETAEENNCNVPADYLSLLPKLLLTVQLKPVSALPMADLYILRKTLC